MYENPYSTYRVSAYTVPFKLFCSLTNKYVSKPLSFYLYFSMKKGLVECMYLENKQTAKMDV